MLQPGDLPKWQKAHKAHALLYPAQKDLNEWILTYLDACADVDLYGYQEG